MLVAGRGVQTHNPHFGWNNSVTTTHLLQIASFLQRGLLRNEGGAHAPQLDGIWTTHSSEAVMVICLFSRSVPISIGSSRPGCGRCFLTLRNVRFAGACTRSSICTAIRFPRIPSARKFQERVARLKSLKKFFPSSSASRRKIKNCSKNASPIRCVVETVGPC